MFPTELGRVAYFPPPSYAVTLQGKDMSEFIINLTLDLHCSDSDENDRELNELCDYITDRLTAVPAQTVLQSLAEALIELHEQVVEEAGQTMH